MLVVASTFNLVAYRQYLHLEDLRQKEGNLQGLFAGDVFVLRTFGGEEDPQQRGVGLLMGQEMVLGLLLDTIRKMDPVHLIRILVFDDQHNLVD